MVKILIVEDINFWGDFIQNFLSSKKVYSDIAKNGMEAVKIVKKDKYDAIIMDINMPLMNGIEAILRIRKLKYKKPIVCFSSLEEDSKEVIFAKENGADGFVHKDGKNLDQLFEILQRLFYEKKY